MLSSLEVEEEESSQYRHHLQLVQYGRERRALWLCFGHWLLVKTNTLESLLGASG